MAVDAAGDIFIADSYNNRIREVVKATGNIITVAGTGTSGFTVSGSVTDPPAAATSGCPR